MPLLNRKPVPNDQYSTSDDDSDNNLKKIDLSDAERDAAVVIETADDMLDDLDMTPALEAESNEEIMRALDSEDDDTPHYPLPVTPVADWLTDVQELARKHGPFAPWQIIKIICALNAPADEASR